MRCFSKSTTCRGKWWVAALIGLVIQPVALAGDGRSAVSLESAVRQAVAEVVRHRMGQDAEVRIENLQVTPVGEPAGLVLTAVPEPGARLARQGRFTLQWVQAPGGPQRNPVAGGYALATVFVDVEHVRAARQISRGESFVEADIVSSRGEVGAVLLQRLPRPADVAGAKALRPLAADEVVTRTAVSVRPMVQSGDVVAVQATADGVTVQGRAVAQQSGGEGDMIRVLNRESRRALKARVVGPGRVEVLR